MKSIHLLRPAMAMSHVRLGILFCSLAFAVLSAFAAQVNLAWDASTSTSVAGYNIYYGVASGSYTSKLSVGNQTSSTVTGLSEGKTYYFAVTARDASGKESARSNEISYNVPSSTTQPISSFTASPTSGAPPLTVTFTGGGTGTITSYAWDFGDGTTSTQQNLTHTYSSLGSYTVTLTVTGPGGSNSSRQTINVSSTTTATGSTWNCPCSLWTSATTPTVASVPDPMAAVNLGVKFKTSDNGYIAGIRFYKGPSNTGTHVGTLWTSSGQKLAEATFSGETATGWQQVKFANPVAVTANTVYVASYHTNVGKFSVDRNYFANSSLTKGPLQALRNGVSGANGVYLYSSSVGFPNTGWEASNYWVDVIFETMK